MSLGENKENFARFFNTAHMEGALDAKTKELMHIVLVFSHALRALSGIPPCRGKEDGNYGT